MGGEEAKVGEGTSVDNNIGMTETGTETGAGDMEVGISQAIQARTRDTAPIILDHIMTATDLYSHLSGVVSIYSIHIVVL